MANDAAFLEPSGPVYTATFSAQTLSSEGPHDLWCVTASTLSRVVIREIRLGQYSDAGDAEAELLSLQILTGSTATSSGSAITPQNVQGHAGAPQAVSSVVGPSTTLASTTSATERWADAWNVAAGLLYAPLPPERIVIEPGQTMCLRMSTPNDELTANGTLLMQEIGKAAG